MTNHFQFKQFTIQQNGAAMKVGTDGVLLGAWTTVKEGRILDIGAGTGLITLMLAQRTQLAKIETIEINKEAYLQTLENVNNSKWFDRIVVHHLALQKFKATEKYDLIVCNPPFFIDSTKAANNSRNTARHTDSLSFSELISAVKQFLKLTGVFSLILPITEASQFIKLAEKHNLLLNKKCIVKPNSIKPAKRVLMEFSFYKNKIFKDELTIETKTRHCYTKEYISLTQDFYLKKPL